MGSPHKGFVPLIDQSLPFIQPTWPIRAAAEWKAQAKDKARKTPQARVRVGRSPGRETLCFCLHESTHAFFPQCRKICSSIKNRPPI